MAVPRRRDRRPAGRRPRRPRQRPALDLRPHPAVRRHARDDVRGRRLALFITNGNPVTQFPDWFGNLTGTFLGLPIEGIILVAIYLIAAFWLRFRPSGRALYAIVGNEEVARLSGINVRGLKVRVYITAGVLAAVAGLLVVSRPRPPRAPRTCSTSSRWS